MNRITLRLTILAGMSAILATGCVAAPKSILRNEGPTMEQVMRSAQSGESASSSRVSASMHPSHGQFSLAHGGQYEGWTRDASNETEQRFPVHINPRLTYYVAPKLVKDRTLGTYLPVPGYTTGYDLYSTTQYALPNELPGSRMPVATPYPGSRSGDDGFVSNGGVNP